MTTPLPTYNIIVAFDKQVFADLKRAAPESMDAFLRNRKDSVLFTNISDNFLRLSHAYTFQEKQGKETDNFTITLELLDPGRVFEQTYLVNSLKQLAAGKSSLFGNDSALDSEISSLRNKLEAVEKDADNFALNLENKDLTGSVEKDLYEIRKNIDNLKKTIEAVKPININVDIGDELRFSAGRVAGAQTQNELNKQKYDQTLKELTPQIEEYTREFEKKRAEYVLSLSTQLKHLEKPVIPTTMYLSYGCGSNIENWAGPFLCWLTGAKFGFSAETGFRTITLVFTVNAQFPGLTPMDDIRFSLGRDLQVFGSHPILTIAKQKNTLPRLNTMIDGSPMFLSEETNLGRIQRIRINNLMQTGLPRNRTAEEFTAEENYIDYHYVICECIKDYIKKCVSNKANVIVLFPDLNELIIPLKQNLEKNGVFDPENQLQGYCDIKLSDGTPLKIPKSEFYFIPEIMRELGFDVTEEIVEDGKILSYKPEQVIGRNGNAAFYPEVVKNFGASSKNLYLNLVKKPGQTFLDPLVDLKNKFPKNLKIIEPTFLVENNADFLRDLKEFCVGEELKEERRRVNLDSKNPYQSKRLEEVITIDETKPLIIYGDKTMIDRFFFGKIRLEEIGIFKFGFGADISVFDSAKDNSNSEAPKAFNYSNLVARRDLKFTSKEYQDLAAKYFQFAKQDNCFNSYKVPTSQFDFESTDAEGLKKSNIPIFKFGVQDSNILDLDIDIDHFYFNILNSVFYQTTNLHKGGKGTKDSLNDKFNPLLELDKNKVAELIKQYMIITPDKPPTLDPSKAEDLKKIPQLATYSTKDLEAAFVSLIAFTDDKGAVLNLDWWKSENPAVHFYSMLSQMSKIAYRGTIRTLPFFHLSMSVGSLNPALLFVKETSILGLNKNSSISDSLNGLWVIYGYEHSIGKGEAYSSFHITKDPRVQLPSGLTPKKIDTVDTLEVEEESDK